MGADCETTVPTYAREIRPIIEQACAYSGCHLNSAPGTYDSYQGLLPALRSGRFRSRVILLREDPTRGMPPAYAPDDRPHQLSMQQLQLIQCWLEADYPQ